MRYYFAPMEGLTDRIFRRIHSSFYPGIDRYYMPFISPTMHRSLTPREVRELPFADDEPLFAIPQLLTHNPDDFLWAAEQCLERGYTEVNLNIGCPSGTVFSKGKGSGMLKNPDQLQTFLDTVFSRAPLPISIKTRIGVRSSEEFPLLLDIYNAYPIAELTVHPRVREAFYKGSIDREALDYAVNHSKNPICVNGDLTSPADLLETEKQYPTVSSLMLGRGLIRWPGMLNHDQNPEVLEQYLTALMDAYVSCFGSERNAMFRMKEHWFYLLPAFPGSEKLGKQLRKTTSSVEYRGIVHRILQELPYSP